jgi:hypothetical protein
LRPSYTATQKPTTSRPSTITMFTWRQPDDHFPIIIELRPATILHPQSLNATYNIHILHENYRNIFPTAGSSSAFHLRWSHTPTTSCQPFYFDCRHPPLMLMPRIMSTFPHGVTAATTAAFSLLPVQAAVNIVPLSHNPSMLYIHPPRARCIFIYNDQSCRWPTPTEIAPLA